MQHAFNKYGTDKFEFRIIEICQKEQCLEKEQYWLDHFKSYDHSVGYNINPKATGLCMTEEVKKKKSEKMKLKYASGEMDHVLDIIRNHEPWNKGKKYKSTDHLKVPKKNKGDRTKDKETKRTNSPKINVYDINHNYIGTWRSAKDLEEYSLSSNCSLNIIPEKVRNNPRLLQSCNINRACKTGKTYKNLYFEYAPLSTEMQIE